MACQLLSAVLGDQGGKVAARNHFKHLHALIHRAGEQIRTSITFPSSRSLSNSEFWTQILKQPSHFLCTNYYISRAAGLARRARTRVEKLNRQFLLYE